MASSLPCVILPSFFSTLTGNSPRLPPIILTIFQYSFAFDFSNCAIRLYILSCFSCRSFLIRFFTCLQAVLYACHAMPSYSVFLNCFHSLCLALREWIIPLTTLLLTCL